MSLKTTLINLAGSVGKCQENARSLKQCLELGLIEASKDAPWLDGAISTKKLWVNANPSTSFSGGDVTVDNSDDYDAFIIFLKGISNDMCHSAMCLKANINDNTQHSYSISHINTSNNTIIECIRKASLTQAEESSNVVFTFTGCSTVAIDVYGTSTATSTTNSVLIPEVIVGVKF